MIIISDYPRPVCEGVAPVRGEEGGEEEDHGV